ncbi:MAG: glycosyltransferase [Microbacteriaceae bacterium]
MTSVVIAAHNEATVIGRCLDALLADDVAGDFDVTVVPNGCTDATAAIAASRGVRVVELGQASKAAALNAGDKIAVGFPRIYLDADIVVSTAGARALSQLVDIAVDGTPTIHAAVPVRALNLKGRPLPVRAYFAINNRLPVFQNGLFGRGMIAVSEVGRSRFDQFPDMMADDLFLDSLFTDPEKACADGVVTTVAAPLRTRDLMRRLVRVRRGNAAMRTAGSEGRLTIVVRPSDRMSWLRDVVRPNPRLAPAGLLYFGISVVAALLARRSPEDDTTWQRDESTRTGLETGSALGPGTTQHDAARP